MRTPVHENTPLHCHTHDALHRSTGIRELDPLDHDIERRSHQVENSVSNVRDHVVETISANAANLSTIVHAEDKNTAAAVGESGKAVGQIVASRSPDLLAGEDNFLEL